MKPATRLHTIVAGIHRWNSWHTEWKIDFSSYAVVTSAGVWFLDPMRPAPALAKTLRSLGEPVGIFLTNANHERDADWFRRELQIQIYAHEKAIPECDLKVDVPVVDGEKLPGDLRVIYLPGAGPGECGLLCEKTLLLGDALIHPKNKPVERLPDAYCEDPRQLARSLKKLQDFAFDNVTFAHGEPLVGNAVKQLTSLIKSRKTTKSS
ncbi:MAG: hypothetical protein N3A53_06290 [Verrucomicrobiae bacterium]|nr:hypothetical protein [Verrucomicrobiae bacterium]MCX7915895.1 hypothetical protein [Verrucomicrobiae bacterium]MDW8344448.1 hypothetical protein [Verrucomicrobiae bacterium]